MIATLGITTRGRPASLRRAVHSFADNARAFGRRIQVMVVDDAMPGGHASSRPVAEGLARELPDVAFSYLGYEEKHAFVDALQRAGLPADVLAFGFLDPEATGYTLGANRNALQLATPGEHVLYVDDDAVAEPSRPPDWEEGVAATGPGTTQDYWFFESRAAALGAVTAAPADVLALHERYLGKTCRSILDGEPAAPETLPSDNRWLHYMRERSVVKITLTGSVGDCCMFSNIGNLLHGRPRTMGRLLASAATLRHAVESREIVRSATSATLRLGGLLIGPVFGCDHSELLPPFMPVFRSSDSTFSNTVSLVYPTHALADIPWLLLHDPEPGRRYQQRGVNGPWHCSVGEVVRGLLFLASGSHQSFADPLGTCGRKLMAFGGLPQAEFAGLIRPLVDEMIELRAERLSALVEQAGDEAPHYTAVLRRSIGWLEESLQDERRHVPVELREGRSSSQALAHTQHLVRGFGRLLELWPEADRLARAGTMAPAARRV